MAIRNVSVKKEMQYSKVFLRERLREERKNLSSSEVRQKGDQAQLLLMRQQIWERAQQVILYTPVHKEVDTFLLIATAWKEGKTVLLPRTHPTKDGLMELAICHDFSQLTIGRFGILEPDIQRCPTVSLDGKLLCPDLAVIPGIGFDRRGNRIGFGAGYYDRILSHPTLQQATMLGYAYAFQLVDFIPADPWDTPMNGICTEENILWL